MFLVALEIMLYLYVRMCVCHTYVRTYHDVRTMVSKRVPYHGTMPWYQNGTFTSMVLYHGGAYDARWQCYVTTHVYRIRTYVHVCHGAIVLIDTRVRTGISSVPVHDHRTYTWLPAHTTMVPMVPWLPFSNQKTVTKHNDGAYVRTTVRTVYHGTPAMVRTT